MSWPDQDHDPFSNACMGAGNAIKAAFLVLLLIEALMLL